MKRILCVLCAFVLCAPIMVSCSESSYRQNASSSNADAVDFLKSKGVDTASLIIGDSELAASYDIDMSDFEEDGYIIRTFDGKTAILGKSASGVDRAVRDYAKHSDTPQYTAVCGEGYRIKNLTVSGNSVGEYEILIPVNADESVRFAGI